MSAPEPLRIAMWSGPRNISTAMMRSFENRSDTVVVDEPFYAAYLAASGEDHPMRAEVLAGQSADWRAVAESLTGQAPGGAAVFYQKHMTHHMVSGVGLEWMARCRNVFLIRRPNEVIASYAKRRRKVTLEDIGFRRQAELFDLEADRLGLAPTVIDAADVLENPGPMMRALCGELGMAFSDRMLAWPAGRRPSDGVWAPAWYDRVERSTGFQSPSAVSEPLLADEQRVADAAQPYYDQLARWRMGFSSSSPAPLRGGGRKAMRLSKPRIMPVEPADWTDEQKALLEPMAARRPVINIFKTLARDPAALRAFLAWGSYVLSRENALPAREREIVVLRTGWLCRSGYEWTQHVPIGRRAALTDDEIARIKTGAKADGWSEADRALLTAGDELHGDHFISDTTWAALKVHFSDKQCMDLVFTVGQYTQVSMILNSFGVQLDPGQTLDPDLDRR